MKTFRAPFLSALILVPTTALPDDLNALVKEYLDAKPKVKGTLEERAERAKSNVAPVLKKIGELDTNESLAFLVQEMDTALPEIGAACAAPILLSKSPNALGLVIKGFSKRNRVVAEGILGALSATSKDLSPIEADLVQIAHSNPEPALRRRLPPVLGKLASLAAVKALLACIPGSGSPQGRGKGEDAPQALAEAVFNALKEAKSEEVRRWLAQGAFEASRGDPVKLTLLARLAGHLGLGEARGELQKLAGNSNQQVSAAAVSALAKVGFGETPDEIIAALEKRKGKGDLAFRIQALDALAATGTDEALEVVLRFARGSDPEMRAVAVGSLPLFKQNKKAVAAIMVGLEDAESNVRANALKSMAELVAKHPAAREKAMIPPLIKVIEGGEDRLKVQAVQLLVGLTGQNMGLVGEDWRKWWEISEARFEFPKEGKKGSTGVKVHDLAYFGIEVSSKKVSFVIDISSSMEQEVAVKVVRAKKGDEAEKHKEAKTGVGGGKGAGEGDSGVRVKDGKAKKIEVLKHELVKVLKALPAETQINIITFNRDFAPWQRELQPLAGSGRAKAIEFVKGLGTGTGTNVFDSLEFALKDRRADTIYLLSDGEPSAGRIQDLEGVSREIKAQNRVRGVTIHCIAFGEDSELLKRLAKENGGEFRFVDQIDI